ncbi:MAG: FAD-dependent oxidoreductase, partial [Pseudomonadales bacterium]
METTDSNKPQIECDIAVIGAGVAGMGAAYFLSQDANVVVLEQEDQPAYHSSGRSAALYIEGYENPVVAGLTAASGDFFRQPPAALTTSPLLHDRGGLTVAQPGEAGQL